MKTYGNTKNDLKRIRNSFIIHFGSITKNSWWTCYDGDIPKFFFVFIIHLFLLVWGGLWEGWEYVHMTEDTPIVQKRASDTLTLQVPKVVNHPWVLGPRPGSSTRVPHILKEIYKNIYFCRSYQKDRMPSINRSDWVCRRFKGIQFEKFLIWGFELSKA